MDYVVNMPGLCKCFVTLTTGGAERYVVNYCPLHAAAPEMLEIIKVFITLHECSAGCHEKARALLSQLGEHI